jgi:hypothetical protein
MDDRRAVELRTQAGVVIKALEVLSCVKKSRR